MKKNIILGTVLVSSMVLGLTAGAAEYPDSTHANSNGKVKFIEGDPEIVDPGNPDKPVTPEKPVNPNKGDLMIQYVSDFDFGIHKKTVNGVTANSVADLVTYNDVKDGTKEEVVPFVSTLDTRTDREGGWNLRVSATEFEGKTESKKDVKLKGAELIFSNVNYANPVTETPVVEEIAAKKLEEGGLKLNSNPQKIATADESKVVSQGMGTYSLALGSTLIKQTDDNPDTAKATYNVTDGVTFNLPKNASVSVADYNATINWELVPGI